MPAKFPMTKEDVFALRNADDISFHHHEGTDTIRLRRRSHQGPHQGLFTETEQRVFYRTEYGDERVRVIEMGDPSNFGFTAFASTSKWDDARWVTIARTIRPGDEVSLVWRPDDHTNDYLRNARPPLHADVLDIRVVRGNKIVGAFMVATSITPDNSARMIQMVNEDGLTTT